MSDPIDRRHFLKAAASTGLVAAPLGTLAEAGQTEAGNTRSSSDGGPSNPKLSHQFLTDAQHFVDVSRGNPKPSTLTGDAQAKARLTATTWRLEIVSDGSADLEHQFRLSDGSALDLESLKLLAKSHGIQFLKAMQCNNIPFPLGQGLWEGVPLREVIRKVGKVGNVRRVYFSGFHNNDPAQLFQSSLAFNRVMESPPSEPPAIVAFRLNGQDIPPARGGPVRMIVPWAHGFKSIKWLQQIVLTNDYKANDTYALQNNDPESYLKTAAYLRNEPLAFKAGDPIFIDGVAMVGWSGLKRVEYWIRPENGTPANLDDDDPAWKTAEWKACQLMPAPEDWKTVLPRRTSVDKIWGFDPRTQRSRDWPLPFSMVSWSARITGLAPGSYALRARSIDLNDFAQPEPRRYQKSGLNRIPVRPLIITA
jgi:DMSO/TMAO reductase YedYZ molybdopterin-dependent catalytic subunit